MLLAAISIGLPTVLSNPRINGFDRSAAPASSQEALSALDCGHARTLFEQCTATTNATTGNAAEALASSSIATSRSMIR